MKKIIAATDFSSAGTNASQYAADLAIVWEAELILLHVAHVPVSVSEIPVVLDEEGILREAEEQLRNLRLRLEMRTRGLIKINTLIDEGSLYHFLKQECEQNDPVLVVIGMQGKSPMQKMFFGSHTEHILQELPYPVLAVPPALEFKHIQRIGLACDYKDVLNTVPIDIIRAIVKICAADLHVLNVSTAEKFDSDFIFQSGILQEMLQDMKPTYHFTNGPDPEEGVLEFVRDHRLDLLIVLPKKHNFIFHWLRKSYTKQFALDSPIPLLSLHAQ